MDTEFLGDRRCQERRENRRRGKDRRCLAWREGLVHANLGLAMHLAGKYANRGIPRSDLNQVATVGLCRAARRFDPSRGKPFAVYATPTILGALKHHFRDASWDVHVPRTLRQARGAVTGCIDALPQKLGRMPSNADVCTAMGWDQRDFDEIRLASAAYQTSAIPRSSDGTNCGPQNGHRSPRAASPLSYYDPAFAIVLDAMFVDRLLDTLTEDQRRIIHWTYWDGMSQYEIASRLGVSQMQVSRLFRRAMATLTETLQDSA